MSDAITAYRVRRDKIDNTCVFTIFLSKKFHSHSQANFSLSLYFYADTGDWIIIGMHFLRQFGYMDRVNGTTSSTNANSTDDWLSINSYIDVPKYQHFVFFFSATAIGSYAIYFSIGGFLHVNIHYKYNKHMQNANLTHACLGSCCSGTFTCVNATGRTNGNASRTNSSRPKSSGTRSSSAPHRFWW